MVYCAVKLIENLNLCYKSKGPHFLWVYRRDNPYGMLGEHKKSLISHASVRRADYVTTTTTKQNGLQVLAGVSFQNHLQIFCMFEELLHLLTLLQVHNGP